MDESLARGFARKAIRDAAARCVEDAVMRAAGPWIPRDRTAQMRWMPRVIRAAGPALIGRHQATLGKRFAFALPIVEVIEGDILGEEWRGIGLGELVFKAGPQGQRIDGWTLLALDLHALTRIGQRGDVVGLDNVLALVSPALPWCLAHRFAAAEAGADRVWLPVSGGVLVCRDKPAVHGDGTMLFAATYLSEARLPPSKTRVLAAMRAAQARTSPQFPFLREIRWHVAAWTETVEQLLPVYARLPEAEDEQAA